MARRADDVARRKPDKEKIEETAFDFGVFIQCTHPQIRMIGVMIQAQITNTKNRISSDLFNWSSSKMLMQILVLRGLC
jgi:hypothetical protein